MGTTEEGPGVGDLSPLPRFNLDVDNEIPVYGEFSAYRGERNPLAGVTNRDFWAIVGIKLELDEGSRWELRMRETGRILLENMVIGSRRRGLEIERIALGDERDNAG